MIGISSINSNLIKLFEQPVIENLNITPHITLIILMLKNIQAQWTICLHVHSIDAVEICVQT